MSLGPPTPKKNVWSPKAGYLSSRQLWWVTFWSCKDSMKGGELKTVLWQLDSLIVQTRRMQDGNEEQAQRTTL